MLIISCWMEEGLGEISTYWQGAGCISLLVAFHRKRAQRISGSVLLRSPWSQHISKSTRDFQRIDFRDPPPSKSDKTLYWSFKATFEEGAGSFVSGGLESRTGSTKDFVFFPVFIHILNLLTERPKNPECPKNLVNEDSIDKTLSVQLVLFPNGASFYASSAKHS